MSLKINEILFTGPFDKNTYEFKKNKHNTLILIVQKAGKNYNPVFYALKIIKTNQENLNLKEFINNSLELQNEKDLSIFIREYKPREISKFEKDFNLLSNRLTEEGNLLMQY